jgi:two-component sensor histidine kinase
MVQMSDNSSDRTVEKLLRQQAALAKFGSFAFRETDLLKILTEAARICAASLEVPFCKVCRYRPGENDLLIVAGCGWDLGVIGRVVSQANESSPQGRAYVTGQPVIIRNLREANNLNLPAFYEEHGIVSTVDVVIPAVEGAAYGVLEVDSPSQHQYDVHDINFLTGFANVLAEAVATASRVEALRQLLEAKNLLAEELQHRVRNNLYMITGLLESYARSATGEAARQGIGRILHRVTTLAQVYDTMLGVGLSETIDLGDYLRTLCEKLPELQNEQSRKIDIVCRTEPLLLGVDDVSTLGMVLAELISNSYGHAFPDRDGTITVTLARSGPAAATLTVQDDGIGFDAKAESSRHGIDVVRRLLQRMSATLDVHSVLGTIWKLEFPISAIPDGVKAAA